MAFRQSLAAKLLVALCSIIALALGLLLFVVNRSVSQVTEAQATQMTERSADGQDAKFQPLPAPRDVTPPERRAHRV